MNLLSRQVRRAPIAALDWFLSPTLRAASIPDLRRARFLAGASLVMSFLLLVTTLDSLRRGIETMWLTLVSFVVWAAVLPLLRFGRVQLAGVWIANFAQLSMLFVLLHHDAAYLLFDPWQGLIMMICLYLGGPWMGGASLGLILGEMILIPVLGRHGWLIETRFVGRSGPSAVAEGTAIAGIFALGWLHSTAREEASHALHAALHTLSESREQFRALVERTHTIPLQIDQLSLSVSYVGPQAEAFLGVSIEAWLAPQFMTAHVHPDDLPVLRDYLQTGWRKPGGEVEVRFQDREQRWKWARVILSPSAEGSALFHGLLLDVTDRRTLESDLQQAQKLESVGRLASGIAHEINTPIQFVSDSVAFIQDAFRDTFSVLGAYQHLRDQAREVPALADCETQVAEAEQLADLDYLTVNVPKALARSVEGLERVSTLVRSMKEFAHPDQKEVMDADINQALATTLSIARNEYKYVADVQTDFGEIPLLPCHIGEINQVFLNLIVNAAHAIGEVVGDTEQRGLIRVATRRDGDALLVLISDSGGGIPEAIRAKIFDPFFTTKPIGKGTGQGLAIARNIIVDKHGGSITLESALGRGTTFTLRLPLAGTPAATAIRSAA